MICFCKKYTDNWGYLSKKNEECLYDSNSDFLINQLN